MPRVISWKWNDTVPLAPEIQQLTVGAAGLLFVTGVKFTRKSPQNAFNVSYSFQFWKVLGEAMYSFPCTEICLPKLELLQMMGCGLQTTKMSPNYKAFF